MNHLYLDEETKEIIVYQGKHVQQEGTVLVRVIRDEQGAHQVSISGTACLNGTLDITI